MTSLREPSVQEEREIAERAGHLKALLDAARDVGMTGHPEYGWNAARPAEPRIVVADVPVHAEGGQDEPEFVIGEQGSRRVSVTRVDQALRTIRAIAATGRTTA